MNIAKIMIPKVLTAFLHEESSVRRGMELMRRQGYTAIPVLDAGGTYVGTVTEGDFLRLLVSVGSTDPKDYELRQIKDIVRRDFCPPLGIDADESEVISAIMSQNFVPIVDVRGILCGILTRRAVIKYLAGKAGIETEPEEKTAVI